MMKPWIQVLGVSILTLSAQTAWAETLDETIRADIVIPSSSPMDRFRLIERENTASNNQQRLRERKQLQHSEHVQTNSMEQHRHGRGGYGRGYGNR